MKWDSNTCVACFGKAFSGKTYFERAHIMAMPKTRAIYIYDFTREYEDLKQKNIHVWSVKRGTQAEIEEFIGYVYARGNCTVVLSECDNYLAMNSPVLLAFTTTARNRGINFIVDAKRAKSVKPSYRSRFNRLILFQCTLIDDIEYLEDWIGQGKGSLSMLRNLSQGQFIEVDLDADEISEVQRL
jgi:hypothetical protein